MATIGMLHPGAMGAAVAALLATAGHHVVWAGDERSATTRDRAAGLEDVGSVAAVADAAAVVVSLCPPAAATEVATAVAAAGFTGTYVEANAVRPATVVGLADVLGDGVELVDGSVVGGPPVAGDDHPTRLYLSGPGAEDVADLFDDDALEVVALDGPVGAASALKMAFAGWTKGTAALAVALRAYARAEGVEEAVLAEWARSLPGLVERTERTGPLVAKAWRFEGELREIGTALADRGLPPGFHDAAAAVYADLADLRHEPEAGVDDVLDRLLPRRR